MKGIKSHPTGFDMLPRRTIRNSIALVCLLTICSFAHNALGQDCLGWDKIWAVNGAAAWDARQSWKPLGAPKPKDNTCIDSVGGVAELNPSRQHNIYNTNNLFIGNGNTVAFTAPTNGSKDEATLNVYGSTINNMGNMLFDNPNGSNLLLNASKNANATVTLAGSGVFQMNAANSAIRVMGDSSKLMNESNIKGRGVIRATYLTNKGSVVASIAGEDLSLYVGTSSNSGTLQATNGGLLYVGGTIPRSFTNSGKIAADSKSSISMYFSDLTNAKGGMITANGTDSTIKLMLYASGSENNGNIQATDGGRLTLSTPRGFTNKGTLQASQEDYDGNNESILIVNVGTDKGVTFKNDNIISAYRDGIVAFKGGPIVTTGVITAYQSGTIDFTNVKQVDNNKGTTEVKSGGTITGRERFTNRGGVILEDQSSQFTSLIYLQQGGFTRDDGVLAAATVGINGGILFGTGSVTVGTPQSPAALINGGILFAGDGTPNGGSVPNDAVPGKLTINGSYQQTASGVLYELMKNSSLFSTTIISGGTATLDGILNVKIDGFNPGMGKPYEILAASNGVLDFFANAEPTRHVGNEYIGSLTADGYKFDVDYYETQSESTCGTGFLGCVELDNFTLEPVSEPGSLFVVGSGLFCLGFFLRKRLYMAT